MSHVNFSTIDSCLASDKTTVALFRTLIMAGPKCFNPFKVKSRGQLSKMPPRKKNNVTKRSEKKRKEKPPTAVDSRRLVSVSEAHSICSWRVNLILSFQLVCAACLRPICFVVHFHNDLTGRFFLFTNVYSSLGTLIAFRWGSILSWKNHTSLVYAYAKWAYQLKHNVTWSCAKFAFYFKFSR